MELTKVCVLGVMHGLHKNNELYSYDDIFKIIENFSPQVIGLEIRSEDMGESVNYLSKYYPYEMVEARERFAHRCKIYGFDWFSKELEGKLLYEGCFNYKISLEKEFEMDKKYERLREVLELNDNIRLGFISKSNAKEINSNAYDMLSKLYYEQLKVITKDTPYEKLSNIYGDRDKYIDENILNIIKENRGKRILILTGIDHRIYIIDAIKKNINDKIEFISV